MFVLVGIGITDAVLLLVGTALGWLGDHQLGTGPVLLFVVMTLGIIAEQFMPISKYAGISTIDWRLAT